MSRQVWRDDLTSYRYLVTLQKADMFRTHKDSNEKRTVLTLVLKISSQYESVPSIRVMSLWYNQGK